MGMGKEGAKGKPNLLLSLQILRMPNIIAEIYLQ